MKHHATVQTVRERYNSRREKNLKKLLRISSRRLMYRPRALWTAAWCFICICMCSAPTNMRSSQKNTSEFNFEKIICPKCIDVQGGSRKEKKIANVVLKTQNKQTVQRDSRN